MAEPDNAGPRPPKVRPVTVLDPDSESGRRIAIEFGEFIADVEERLAREREAVRHLLRTRNTEGLTARVTAAGIIGVHMDAYAEMVEEELAGLDHDTQEWWGVPCNCEGQLN